MDNNLLISLWTRYFIEAQGFTVVEPVMYQDKIISMFLEKNGQNMITHLTKHIWVRHFFIKDWVAIGNVTLKRFM